MPKAKEEVVEEILEEPIQWKEGFPKDDVEEEPIYAYEGSLTNLFLDTLVGEQSFKDFVKDSMNEKIWVKEEADDLNYYDWLFNEHLIDSFIEYSKSIMSDVNKKSKKKDLKHFVENVNYVEGENITWHDIYSLIVKQNKNKRIATYIKENK